MVPSMFACSQVESLTTLWSVGSPPLSTSLKLLSFSEWKWSPWKVETLNLRGIKEKKQHQQVQRTLVRHNMCCCIYLYFLELQLLWVTLQCVDQVIGGSWVKIWRRKKLLLDHHNVKSSYSETSKVTDMTCWHPLTSQLTRQQISVSCLHTLFNMENKKLENPLST